MKSLPLVHAIQIDESDCFLDGTWDVSWAAVPLFNWLLSLQSQVTA